MTHTFHRRTRLRTLLIALLTALALLAVGCGSSGEDASESATTTIDSTSAPADDAAEGSPDAATNDELAMVDASDEVAEPETADVETAPDDAEADSPATEAAAPESDSGALVLTRAAAQASQAQAGYRIDQGMGLRMSLLNGFIDMSIAPEGPIATGEVAGDASHLTLDFGAFILATLGAQPMGGGPTDAEIAEMTEAFADAQIESWQDGSTLYLDMSTMLTALDEMGAGEDPAFASLAAGPVKVDLDQLGLSGAQAAAGLGQGMTITDPGALLDALVALDAVNENGTAEVRGVPTTVYAGTMSMLAYSEATGVDLADQLGALDDLGLGDPAAITSLYDVVNADITAMVDDAGLVRRIEVVLDMAPMMMAMFGDPEMLGAATGQAPSEEELAELQMLLGDDLEFVTETWQEFYDYGETFVIEPPLDATDITDQYTDLSSANLLDA